MPASNPEESDMKSVDWQAALVEHDRWLRLVVLARLGERTALEDVMQDVALAAAKGAEKLRDPSKIAPWLYRLAVTAALQHRRRMGRRRKHTANYEAQNAFQTQEAPDPLEWLIAKEQQQLIKLALKQLPSKDTEILLLKYAQDLSYAELARRLSISESAVDGRLQRARKKLRTALQQRDPSLVAV